jgi:coenzyme F420-0:L-glutamate ligase/coenzyme F420-1:gamma-L-glutamate ligase
MADSKISIFGIPGLPEIKSGDDLSTIIFDSMVQHSICFKNKDVLVVAQKIVSKAEGRVYEKKDILVSQFAEQFSHANNICPHYLELVLQESKRIVRMVNHLVISQTKHGFVMAGAGVDQSNAGGEGLVVALPRDPDLSALRLKKQLEDLSGVSIAIIISDTFGRPWRRGQVNQAIGLAGIEPFLDYRRQKDNDGREMKVTKIAVVDELASAAELISGKTARMPVVVIRGVEYSKGSGTGKDLVRDKEKDIFK